MGLAAGPGVEWCQSWSTSGDDRDGDSSASGDASRGAIAGHLDVGQRGTNVLHSLQPPQWHCQTFCYKSRKVLCSQGG